MFLAPGTFGSYVMAEIVRDAGKPANVAWAETGTLPYLARKHGEREVNVTVRAIRLPTGVYPARSEDDALAVIRRAYPSRARLRRCAVGRADECRADHPPAADGDERGAAAALRALGHPQRGHAAGGARRHRPARPGAHRRARGLRLARPHYPLADHYNNDRWMYGDAHKQLVKSGDWREHIDLHTHRYITEDTELGLAFLASAARYAGVDAPIAHGLLAIVGGFLGRDLRHGPRTFEALGLAPTQARGASQAAA